ncbi:hypothetical protein F7725_025622 [Dissostichus mawsoni]|uniref:Uncharacterized protein n=1 Tax=Dissostichus mawsoni TaxID=36200 RepID=A0A7J5XDR8_DISMA|nr:hypothetical protein F7725_025622 [Dissostichus mawsoni]
MEVSTLMPPVPDALTSWMCLRSSSSADCPPPLWGRDCWERCSEVEEVVSMCCYIVQTVAMVMREGEHLLCHRVPDNSHETQTGCGATRRRFVAAVRRVVAVLVPLILMVPQGLHVLDGELGGGDRLALRLQYHDTRKPDKMAPSEKATNTQASSRTTTRFQQDLDPGPTCCLRLHRLPQDAARHPAAAHLQQRKISSFPNCSSRALLQLQAYLFTSSAGSRIKLRRRSPARVSGSSRLSRIPGHRRKKDKEVGPHGSPNALMENLLGSLQPRLERQALEFTQDVFHDSQIFHES